MYVYMHMYMHLYMHMYAYIDMENRSRTGKPCCTRTDKFRPCGLWDGCRCSTLAGQLKRGGAEIPDLIADMVHVSAAISHFRHFAAEMVESRTDTCMKDGGWKHLEVGGDCRLPVSLRIALCSTGILAVARQEAYQTVTGYWPLSSWVMFMRGPQEIAGSA